MRRRKKYTKVDWQPAPEIRGQILHLVEKLEIDWVQTDKIYAVRSSGSTARAYARIWVPRRRNSNMPKFVIAKVITMRKSGSTNKP